MCMHAAPVTAEWDEQTWKMPRELAFQYAGFPIKPGKEQNEAMTPPEVREWIEHHFEDFIWVGRGGEGVCTACHGEMNGIYTGHKEYISCPCCGKYVQVRYKRYGRKRLEEKFYTIHWRKSPVDEKALIMTGYYCYMDSSIPDPEYAEKLIVPVQLDVFRYGKGAGRWQRPVWGYGARQGEHEWYRCRDVRALGKNYFGTKVDTVKSETNFRMALEGTPFEGAMELVEETLNEKLIYITGDPCEMVAAIARRPWVEYMIKAGFKDLGIACMGQTPKGLILPKRKHVRQILRLSVDRYAEIKSKKKNIDVTTLEILQSLDGAGVKVKLEEAIRLSQRLQYYRWKEDVLARYGQIDRALVKYLLKNEIGTLMDYWREAGQAGIDMTLPEAKLPPNLQEAHDRAVEMNRAYRRMNAQEKANAKQETLEKRLAKLEKRYCFEFDGLILRPARKLIELVDEGNALSHCVGGYTESYALGRTDICFLRKADAPDTPWRTIEFDPRTGRLIQDRGYKNDWALGPNGEKRMTDELRARLKAFWAAFYAAHADLKAS